MYLAKINYWLMYVKENEKREIETQHRPNFVQYRYVHFFFWRSRTAIYTVLYVSGKEMAVANSPFGNLKH